MPENFQDRNEAIGRLKEAKSGSETDPNKPVDRLDAKGQQKREDFLKQNQILMDTLIKWLGDWRDSNEINKESKNNHSHRPQHKNRVNHRVRQSNFLIDGANFA